MRYLSSANIKTAAAQQPDPERTKNLLGELMPMVTGGLTAAGTHAIGDLALREALHLGKFKNPRTAMALALGNMLGSSALGYTTIKRLQNQPTNKLPEIYLNPKQSTK